MKKLVSMLLALAVLCSAFALFTVSGSAAIEQKFIVDGNLDIWYISSDEYPANDPDHPNYYHYTTLECKMKDGVGYYDAPVTAGQVWTAWDDDYVYIYAKVWDEELVKYDDTDKTAFPHSGFADSVEIWFDPDPNSQTHTFTYDADGNIIAETPKAEADILSGWYNNTSDPAQGDTQLRIIPANGFLRHDHHDVIMPGYNGVGFKEYVNNSENVCAFSFSNEPFTFTNDYGDEYTLSSGYGVEARFPRNNDAGGHYRFNVAFNQSAEWESERYTLCTGGAWWLDYSQSWQVKFFDGIENPFFNQPAEQLEAKSTLYTDSEINQKGAVNDVVTGIGTLPESVTDANKATVETLIAAYDKLTDVEKGFVAYKNGAALEAAAKALGIEFNLSEGGEIIVGPGIDVQDVIDLITALPEEITLKDTEAVEQIGRLMDRFSEDELAAIDDALMDKYLEAVITIATLQIEEALGDVYVDGEIDAKDALKVLQAAVDKVTLQEDEAFAADVNFDGAIDATDALEILQVAVGTREKFSGLEEK